MMYNSSMIKIKKGEYEKNMTVYLQPQKLRIFLLGPKKIIKFFLNILNLKKEKEDKI